MRFVCDDLSASLLNLQLDARVMLRTHSSLGRPSIITELLIEAY